MFTQIVTMVLPVLVMIALGRVCAVTGILNDEQHTGIKNIIGNILLPVVLFQAFFTADYGLRMLLVFVLVFVLLTLTVLSASFSSIRSILGLKPAEVLHGR